MSSRIRGSIAVVTGAASGIGRALAYELARRGGIVAGIDVSADALRETMTGCGGESYALFADVSSRAECERAVREAIERFGRVDILVNCAGIGLRTHATEITPDDIERVFGVNFFGAVYLATAVLPGMIARGSGSIVNVTSVAGYLPNPRESAYGATKAALSMWTHGLAVDLRGTGVHVGVLSPGPTDTGIWSTLDERPAYRGRLFAPSVIARGAAEMIERERMHVTIPRRYGALAILYPLFGRPMRWALSRYDRRS